MTTTPVDTAVSHGFAHNPRHLSTTNEHFTPVHIVEATRETFGGAIDLDPATTVLANEHRIHAEFIYTQEDDGYRKEWHGRVLLNPPGGKCDENGVSVTSEVLAEPGGAPLFDKKGKLKKEWFCANVACQGSVDHPGVASSQKRWWQKMVTEWMAGRLKQGIFVSFSVELFQTTQVRDGSSGAAMLPLPLDFPFCMPKVRLAYDREIENITTNEVKYVTGGSPPHASALIYLPEPGDEQGIDRFIVAFSKIGKVVVPRKLPEVPKPIF